MFRFETVQRHVAALAAAILVSTVLLSAAAPVVPIV